MNGAIRYIGFAIAAYMLYSQMSSAKQRLEDAEDAMNQGESDAGDIVLEGAYKDPERDPNSELDGVTVSAVLQVGNIGGKVCQIKPIVTITNKSGRKFYATGVKANFYLLDSPIPSYTPMSEVGTTYIGTNKSYQIPLQIASPGMLSGSNDQRKRIREEITKRAGKKLYTSVIAPKYYEGMAFMNLVFYISDSMGAGGQRVYYGEVPITLQYMGEAFYPKGLKYSYE